MVWDFKERWTGSQKVWSPGLGAALSATLLTSPTSGPARGPGRVPEPVLTSQLPARSCRDHVCGRACSQKKYRSDSLTVWVLTSYRENTQFLVMVFLTFNWKRAVWPRELSFS